MTLIRRVPYRQAAVSYYGWQQIRSRAAAILLFYLLNHPRNNPMTTPENNASRLPDIAVANKMARDQAESKIESEHYLNRDDHPWLGGTTLCILVLKNGARITGEKSCIIAEEFDTNLGRIGARRNAVNKIWELEGYALRERILAATTERKCFHIALDPNDPQPVQTAETIVEQCV